MKVAIFGHYDSRGGTTAIALPDNPTEDDVFAAFTRYDKEVFCIDEAGDIGSTAYGMQARECDKQVHRLIYGDNSVAISDFMYVAEIYGVPDGLIGHDLEEHGSVLLSADSAPRDVNFEARKAYMAKWFVELEVFKASPEYMDRNVTIDDWMEPRIGSRPPEPQYDELVALTVNAPMQMEFVPSKQDGDIDEDIEEARICALAKHIKNPEYHRWDDDAYGFILMGKADA